MFHRCTYHLRRFARFLVLVSGIVAAGFAHAASFRVTTPADAGAGSLRQAILDANARPGLDGINFAIDPANGPGPWTIALRSPLPPVTDRIAMSGFSQPGSRPGFPAQPMIEIDITAMACNANNDFGSALTFVRGAERSLVAGLVFVGDNARCSGAAVLVLADGVKVVANRFGVRANGDVVGLGGVSAAIGVLMSRDAVVGDPDPDNGNIFAGIDSIAIAIDGGNQTVQHNWFGTNGMGEEVPGSLIGHVGVLTGSIALNVPRAYRTIYSIQTQRDSFGLRDSSIVDNRFVAVDFDGIYLHGGAPGPETRGNTIARNRFGTNVWGMPTLGAGTAIRLEDGTRDSGIVDNVVRNGNAGIVLAPRSSNPSSTPAGTGNRFSRNVFSELNSTAIALTTQSPLANDALDADEGQNRLQNRPELVSANTAGLLEGALHSMPGRTYTIEVFLSAACSSSGGDVADLFLQSFDVTTDGQGDASFAQIMNPPPFGRIEEGDVLTATATDADGNTSELSACVSVADLLPVTLTLPAYPTRVPAMDRTLDARVDVSGNGPTPPTGSVVFSVVDPNRISRELGRVPLVNGHASIPTPQNGVLPQAGRYTIEARYEGDARYAANAVSSRAVFVFRPPTALQQIDQSAPVRHDLLSDAREWFDLGSARWMPLGTGAFDAYIDADRFDGLATDQALVRKGREYYTVDAGGRTTLRTSGVIGTSQILDLIQVDGDVEADALVQDPSTRRYAIVQCVFHRDGCEAITPLDVNPELEWRGSGDFDGDGHTDLVFQTPGRGDATIVLMDGVKPRGTVTVRMPDLPSTQIATADVDGDGFDDLLWTDPATNTLEVELFQYGRPSGHVQGDLRTTGWSLPGAVHTARAGAADYGRAELLLGNAAGDATVWTDLGIRMGALVGNAQRVYGNVDFALERTR